jgi:hypothetical protein
MTAKAESALPGVSRGIEGLDVDRLRRAIQEEYALVASEPDRGFHFCGSAIRRLRDHFAR